jgi:hypothetical protein
VFLWVPYIGGAIVIVYEFDEVMNLLHSEQREAVNREIAEAEQRGRDQERERCRLLCVRRYDDYRAISPQFDNENYRANRECAQSLEVAIESGSEPGGDK